MPGPPREPNAVKRAKGNPGQHRLPDEPTPPTPEGLAAAVVAEGWPAGVQPPEWALAEWPEDGAAAAAWRRLHAILDGMGVLETSDADALALLCAALAERAYAQRVLNEEGMTYERITDRGGSSIAVRPESQAAADAWRRAQSMMLQFGLTPSARTKVGGGDRGGEVDPFAEFDGPKIDGGRRAG